MTVEGVLPDDYYESPYLPSPFEARGYLAIPLYPVEAHYIIVNSVGKHLSTIDKLALRRLADSNDPDVQIDLKTVRQEVTEELGEINDWL